MKKERDTKKLADYLAYRIARRLPFIGLIYDSVEKCYKMPSENKKDKIVVVTDGVKLYISNAIEAFYEKDKMLCELSLAHELLHIYLKHPVLADGKKREAYDCKCDREVNDYLRQVYRIDSFDLYPTDIRYMPDYSKKHDIWYKKDGTENQSSPGTYEMDETDGTSAAIQWANILQNQMIGSYGRSTGNKGERISSLSDEETSYLDVVKRYTTIREQPCRTDEELDIMLYSYGFEMYGNIPIVEPPETIEEFTVRLYVAIDTSGSCDQRMVSRFLGQTKDIIKKLSVQRSGSFDIYLFLCDMEISQEFHITSLDEFPEISELLINGGGTSFTPVFERMEEIEKQGNGEGQAALFYYTDGMGAFPEKKSGIDTYFCMEQRDIEIFAGPEWIHTIRIDG